MKNYTINSKVTEGERNKKFAKCYTCGCELKKGEGYSIFIASRGKRVVCPNHYATSNLLSYHGNSTERRYTNNVVGTEKKTALASTTIGIEIETYYSYFERKHNEFSTLRALIENAFYVKAESDCTVSAEFPTEKMQGLATISKVLQSMEKHDLLKYVNNAECGAHVHVYCNKVEYIKRYYHSIFIPLCEYLNNMDNDNMIEYFGRGFNEWAQVINENTEPTKHSNFVNTQHSKTLEFRLPRINNYLQYMNVIKFWRKVGLLINTFEFFENSTDNNTRKAYARKCGNEIVKIAKQHFPY